VYVILHSHALKQTCGIKHYHSKFHDTLYITRYTQYFIYCAELKSRTTICKTTISKSSMIPIFRNLNTEIHLLTKSTIIFVQCVLKLQSADAVSLRLTKCCKCKKIFLTACWLCKDERNARHKETHFCPFNNSEDSYLYKKKCLATRMDGDPLLLRDFGLYEIIFMNVLL
jgi:hypothetical protein